MAAKAPYARFGLPSPVPWFGRCQTESSNHGAQGDVGSPDE